jgi:hypothetical protein
LHTIAPGDRPREGACAEPCPSPRQMFGARIAAHAPGSAIIRE